jgi:hypothetical protein
MFKKPTVFILGAGASWHYSFPTGESLVQEVAAKASNLEGYFESAALEPIGLMPKYVASKLPHIDIPGGNEKSKWEIAWRLAAADCQVLRRKIKAVDPLVIDYFLGQNPEIQSLGKMLIAWVIRERETNFYDNGININHRRNPTQPIPQPMPPDNWVRFLIHRLIVGCSSDNELAANQVSFVTFNYDLSLEDNITKGLRNNSVFTFSGIDRFLADDRFLHVYGKVRDKNNPEHVPLHPLQNPPYSVNPQYRCSFVDDLLRISEGIRTIDPLEKHDDEVLSKIRTLVRSAQCIYILGFGFDRNNCARIGLEPGNFQHKPGNPHVSVMFTNLGDINRINKAASRAFFGHPDAFLNKQVTTENFGQHYYEKSIRDCYGALASDFDELEEY